MNNLELYENLLVEVKGEFNFKENRTLKSIKTENIPLLENKIQKLKKNNRFGQIMFGSILSVMVIIPFILQLDIWPKFHRFFIILLMYLPISLAPVLFGKSSPANAQRKIDIFELMLILTKDEMPEKASDKK